MELLNIMIQKYSNKNNDSCLTYRDILCNIQPTPSRPPPPPHPPPLSPFPYTGLPGIKKMTNMTCKQLEKYNG